MEKDEIISKLKNEGGMMFVPKILGYYTYYAEDLIVYDMLDKIIYFSKDKTGVVSIVNASKKLGLDEKTIMRSIRRLEDIEIVKGKYRKTGHDYMFTINYDQLLTLTEERKEKHEKEKPSNMTEEEKINYINSPMSIEEHQAMKDFKLVQERIERNAEN